MKSKLIILSAFVSVNSFAALVPSTGPVATIAPSAYLPFNSIQSAFESYDSQISEKITNALVGVQSSAVDSNLSITQAVVSASLMDTNNALQVERVVGDLRMNHKKYIEEESDKRSNRLVSFGDGNIGPSRDYFERMCVMAKVNKNLSSPEYLISRAKTQANLNSKNERDVTDPVIANNAKVSKIENRYRSYCDSDDFSAGLCVEEAEIPNADVLSFVFLNPFNDDANRINSDTGYVTQFTYSDYEAKAAREYIDNLAPVFLLKRQLESASSTESGAQVKSRLNQLLSALNLARFNMMNSYIDRLKNEESGLSNIDTLRSRIYDAEVVDIGPVKNASDKGKMLYLLSQMKFNNYLVDRRMQLMRRISEVKAARIAVKLSDPVHINHINSVK